uniref:Uncharacterized protein n=1 Tax=Heterorhabditis bacteriophora TaxID=37862 RepID=A0A1I7WQE6_HETBA
MCFTYNLHFSYLLYIKIYIYNFLIRIIYVILRYLEAQSSADINNLKIMEAAARKDRVVQHAVFSYFQNKKGKDDLALFSKQSKILYDQDEVMEAEREVATAVQFD